MGVRVKFHKKEIEKVATYRAVLRQLDDVGEKISREVVSETSGSRTLRPFGKKMSVVETDKGVRVGTSWGPAVPVEYGSSRTPAKRILLSAAERFGRVSF